MVMEIFCETFAAGINTAVRRRYKAEAMAFWLHLVPKLHRYGSFEPVFHALQDNSTEDGEVRDDATMTQVSMETAPTTKAVLRSSKEGWTSAGDDEPGTSDEGLMTDSTSVSAAGAGSRLLMATLAVGGTLLLINCVVFIAMLSHRSRRIRQLATTKPIKPITYVNSNTPSRCFL